MKTYLFKYHHEGSWYSLELPAESFEDAEARLSKLPHAQYLGEAVLCIPARMGLLARLICWVRNRLGW